MNGNIYDLFLALLIILPFFAGDLKDVIKILVLSNGNAYV